MVLQSRFSISVPNCSIQKWIFGSSSGPLLHGDSKAWVDADNPDTRFLTFAVARQLAKRVAVGLIESGIQPGDRVLVISGNSIIFPAVMLGIWMAGAIFTGANPGLMTRELAYQLRDSEAKFMLAAEPCWDTALEAAGMV
jgi:acyl-CoA synthetase (AMP-forming)/AMP-acid ligase II